MLLRNESFRRELPVSSLATGAGSPRSLCPAQFLKTSGNQRVGVGLLVHHWIVFLLTGERGASHSNYRDERLTVLEIRGLRSRQQWSGAFWGPEGQMCPLPPSQLWGVPWACLRLRGVWKHVCTAPLHLHLWNASREHASHAPPVSTSVLSAAHSLRTR